MNSRSLAFSLALAAAAAALPASAAQFGKPLQGLPPASLAAVLDKPEPGKLVRLEGTIEKVCQGKGCWLELKQAGRGVHVTFEGYSFFVPKDSAGRPVALEGRVVVKEPEASEVEHKQSEGALAAGQKVSVEALGVEIR